MSEIASTFKIAYHKEKLEAYLRNESIFPATLEMDLSSACNRKCPQCPSTTSVQPKNLEINFIEHLFSRLEGQTEGLLLTGGEPTMAPTFPETLRLARRHGFVDVVVVTNGAFLNDGNVAAALVEHASAVRVSMYDWSAESCEELDPLLKQIEALRTRIDREGSKLQIGVSALTYDEKAGGISAVADGARSAGAHWIYFHPTCTNWESGSPLRANQNGVLSEVEKYKETSVDGFGVYIYHDRYAESPLEFSEYHTAHFLLVIGADGMNYLGAEVKYQPQHIIMDVAGNGNKDFLWEASRLERIRAADSTIYPAIGSRHRGVLYNNLIEQLMRSGGKASDGVLAVSNSRFSFPHIL
jgi:hypothetical protein